MNFNLFICLYLGHNPNLFRLAQLNHSLFLQWCGEVGTCLHTSLTTPPPPPRSEVPNVRLKNAVHCGGHLTPELTFQQQLPNKDYGRSLYYRTYNIPFRFLHENYFHSWWWCYLQYSTNQVQRHFVYCLSQFSYAPVEINLLHINAHGIQYQLVNQLLR